ncbi:cyclase family protein [Candidatus Micrarchaeota archaeon]|nr:cyclase family protein [Candidatus Micrarchaeota archaeon]
MLYDVSLPISSRMPIYPGNPRPSLRFYSRRPRASTNLSELRIGSHTGTHVDAPKHVLWSKKSVDQLALAHFHGACRVLDLTHVTSGITASDLQNFRIKKNEIVLFKTRNSLRGFNRFHADYVHVSLDAARFLKMKGVRTLGVDSLSVQRFHSGNQRVHETLLKAGIAVFEGLNLRRISPGPYTFMGLPLLVAGAEASPARVLLSRP